MITAIYGEAPIYKSVDTVLNQGEAVHYPTEFLNSLDLPGLPPHIINLKIGVPIILLTTINLSRLCNEANFVLKKLLNNIKKQ